MLDAPAEAAGLRVRCPVCREAVSVPDPNRRRKKTRPANEAIDFPFDESTSVPTPRRKKKPPKRPDPVEAPSRPPQPRKTRPTRQNVFQPTEERSTVEVEKPRRKKRKKRKESNPGIMRSIAFPFRTEAMLTISVMTVLYTCIMVPMQNVPMMAIFISPRMVVGVLFILMLIQGYFWHFLFEVLRMAAYNDEDLPMVAEWEPENIFYDLVIAVGATLVSFSPLILGAFVILLPAIAAHPFIATIMIGIGVLYLPMAMIRVISSVHEWLPFLIDYSPFAAPGLLALVILPCFYLPMALMASVLHQSVKAAFPWYVVPAMIRMPWAYFETIVLIAGISMVTVFLQFLATYVPILGVFLVWFLVFTGHTAIMHRLGSMYHENRRALDWFPEGPRVI
ncbi:MAG: hypothetical protein KDA93_08680 [Planctomycetaceae bacterium]|nr:hypothetical protein [Planctomycetaceae bacterium]